MKRIVCWLLAFAACISMQAAKHETKVKFPGGKHYIYRYTLRDKQGTPYSLDKPQRWLSHKSIERRKRQGLALDSTDLPVNPKYVKQFNTKRSIVIGTSRWQNTVLVRSNDTLTLSQLGQLPCVSAAQLVWTSPDSIERGPVKWKTHESFNPYDSVKTEYYGNGKQQIEMLKGHRLHAAGLRGQGMTIAILDGGFCNADRIPALSKADIVGARDFVCPVLTENIGGMDQNPAGTLYYETEHGTKVLSCMAANAPTVLVGTAPEAHYWLLRCEDQQTEQPVEEDYWTIAAEFADSVGADIISSSLGYNEYDAPNTSYRLGDLDGHTAFISRTASMLAGKGIVLVNSAGNTGMGPWKKICVPADAHDILTVGALTTTGQSAPFSSVGPTQDNRVKPDIMALGSPAALISGRGTLVRDMGTSFSTPIVAGLVACLWQDMRQKTALDIINLIRESSDNYNTPNNIYGYGMPNFWRAYMVGKMKP